MASLLQRLTRPLITDNPIVVQILGVCSALAVTTSVETALTMSLALTAVLGLASAVISAIRHHVPPSVRLIVQVTIFASMVIVADQVLQAYAYEISQRLSIFVALIATNCLVLGRAEGFAMHNPVLPSFLDGIGNGAGYSIVLLVVAAIRELFGSGTLMGASVLPTVAEGGWFQPLGLMLLAPSAFFIVAFLIWALKSWRHSLAERREFDLRHTGEGAGR